jgi:hypothetical protein
MIIAIEEIQRGGEQYCRVEAEGRFAPPQPFEFRWENDTLVLHTVVPYRERLRSAILRALIRLHQQNPQKAYFTTGEIQHTLELEPAPAKDTVLEALTRLVQEGIAEESPTRGERNTRLWRLVSVSSTGGVLIVDDTGRASVVQSPTDPFSFWRSRYRESPALEAVLHSLRQQGDFAIEPAEEERVRAVWACAEALGFPAVDLSHWDGLRIEPSANGWLSALYLIASTDALDDAMQALLAQVSRSAGEPAGATYKPTLKNGSEQVRPALSQLNLEV